MQKNVKVVSLVVLALLFVAISVYGGYSLIKEEVQVKTPLGCFSVEDKYTDAEWEAKQNLISNLKLQSYSEGCD